MYIHLVQTDLCLNKQTDKSQELRIPYSIFFSDGNQNFLLYNSTKPIDIHMCISSLIKLSYCLTLGVKKMKNSLTQATNTKVSILNSLSGKKPLTSFDQIYFCASLTLSIFPFSTQQKIFLKAQLHEKNFAFLHVKFLVVYFSKHTHTQKNCFGCLFCVQYTPWHNMK